MPNTPRPTFSLDCNGNFQDCEYDRTMLCPHTHFLNVSSILDCIFQYPYINITSKCCIEYGAYYFKRECATRYYIDLCPEPYCVWDKAYNTCSGKIFLDSIEYS